MKKTSHVAKLKKEAKMHINKAVKAIQKISKKKLMAK